MPRRPSKIQETNGAVKVNSKPVSETIKGSNPSTSSNPVKRETNGAYMPITGPITNVHQLVRSKTVAKGSPGSFSTLADYTKYLKGLSSADLHRHAVEEMRIGPIDDRDRLITRLESEWTRASNKLGGDNTNVLPNRAPFSADQLAKQDALRRKMLGGLA